MPNHIQINDDASLSFWCSRFGIGRSELLDAVQVVGGSARLVGEYLKLAKAGELAE